MKKLLVFGVIIGVFVAGLWGYSSMVGNREAIRIGYVDSLSGKFSAMGTAARNGAILAVEELNAKGGIDEGLIDMVIKDDAGLPENINGICGALDNEDVRMVIGPFTTASATKMLPIINKEKILAVGPVVSGDNIGGRDDMFIKIFPSTIDFGEAIAGLAVRQGIMSVTIINDKRNKSFGDTMIRGFESLYAYLPYDKEYEVAGSKKKGQAPGKGAWPFSPPGLGKGGPGR